MEGSTPWLELLLGISGAFRPKVLTCLMGVTGAGKTTLMDVLAGRKTGRHCLQAKAVGCACYCCYKGISGAFRPNVLT